MERVGMGWYWDGRRGVERRERVEIVDVGRPMTERGREEEERIESERRAGDFSGR